MSPLAQLAISQRPNIGDLTTEHLGEGPVSRQGGIFERTVARALVRTWIRRFSDMRIVDEVVPANDNYVISANENGGYDVTVKEGGYVYIGQHQPRAKPLHGRTTEWKANPAIRQAKKTRRQMRGGQPFTHFDYIVQGSDGGYVAHVFPDKVNLNGKGASERVFYATDMFGEDTGVMLFYPFELNKANIPTRMADEFGDAVVCMDTGYKRATMARATQRLSTGR